MNLFHVWFVLVAIYISIRKTYGDCPSDLDSIVCQDNKECLSCDIAATAVTCSGDLGCSNATVTADTVDVAGSSGADSATITSDAVYVTGSYAAKKATIYSPYIEAEGKCACQEAEIYPMDYVLSVSFAGQLSGEAATVYCTQDSTCDITCGSDEGCVDATINCYSGSTCNVYCENSSDDKSYGCEDLTLECYAGSTCVVDCGDDDGCGDLSFICDSGATCSCEDDIDCVDSSKLLNHDLINNNNDMLSEIEENRTLLTNKNTYQIHTIWIVCLSVFCTLIGIKLYSLSQRHYYKDLAMDYQPI